MSRALDLGKVAAARLWAVTHYPFLSAAVLATEIVERDGIGTVATDSRFRLYLDAQFVHRLPVADLGRLVLHHVGHLLRDHAGRAAEQQVGAEVAPVWTRACDAEISDDVPTADLLAMHEASLPQRFGAEPGRFAEQYYAHLRDRHGPRWRWWARDTQVDCGSGADAQPREWDAGDDGGVDAHAGELIRLQVAAAVREHATRDPDAVGGSWQRWADRVVGVSLDWRRVLASEIRKGSHSASGTADHTYRRPSRRASCTPGVVLPSMHHPVPAMAVVCDTSASMDQELLDEALTHLETLLRSVTDRRTPVPVIACDTEVRAVRHVRRASDVALNGGGATDMAAGIAAAAALRPRPSMMVVLTDGATAWPARPPKGTRVVVGLLGSAVAERPPGWAKVIAIRGAG